jgi:hypothetical protein
MFMLCSQKPRSLAARENDMEPDSATRTKIRLTAFGKAACPKRTFVRLRAGSGLCRDREPEAAERRKHESDRLACAEAIPAVRRPSIGAVTAAAKAGAAKASPMFRLSAHTWRRKALKTLNQRPEMVRDPIAWTHKIWDAQPAAATLLLRDERTATSRHLARAARTWRRKALKRLDSRPETVWPREAPAHKIWGRRSRRPVRSPLAASSSGITPEHNGAATS